MGFFDCVTALRIDRDTCEKLMPVGLGSFEHIVVVGANKGILPLDAAVDDAADAVARRDSETGERSLLYVALTRARRTAAITGYGEFTPLIKVP